ncbi:hypothetical protein DOTSEDRAFT_25580 [Dothistroma septosporum NZE10]|uniref:Uncharacterized protein n=1 Tax=Dothistroma septosporum (strain NZE10 / CBS 128990) TaxID=675120 RepID=M2XMH9_DOTSN|nr:hypothetical protein DOTSEDRAFT_25580 [Dothistroma septosporum NZE10]
MAVDRNHHSDSERELNVHSETHPNWDDSFLDDAAIIDKRLSVVQLINKSTQRQITLNTRAADHFLEMPGLLENILLELGVQTVAPFKHASPTNTVDLSQLRLVSRVFDATIVGSTKLTAPLRILQVSTIPRGLIAAAWLLRELGYTDLEVGSCLTVVEAQ